LALNRDNVIAALNNERSAVWIRKWAIDCRLDKSRIRSDAQSERKSRGILVLKGANDCPEYHILSAVMNIKVFRFAMKLLDGIFSIHTRLGTYACSFFVFFKHYYIKHFQTVLRSFQQLH